MARSKEIFTIFHTSAITQKKMPKYISGSTLFVEILEKYLENYENRRILDETVLLLPFYKFERDIPRHIGSSSNTLYVEQRKVLSSSL